MEKDGEDRRNKNERDKRPLARRSDVMSHSDEARQNLVDFQALAETMAEIIESGGRGIVHLDAHGRIIAANDAAVRILEDGDILSDVDKRLFVRNRQDNRELQRVLNRVLPPPGKRAVADSVAVSRPGGRPSLVLYFRPVNGSEKDPRPQLAAVVVVIVDPLRGAVIDPTLIRKALGLTPAESNVASLLAQGMDVRTIADSTIHAENTIRTQVKSILGKLGLNRKGALVHLVRSLGVFP